MLTAAKMRGEKWREDDARAWLKRLVDYYGDGGGPWANWLRQTIERIWPDERKQDQR